MIQMMKRDYLINRVSFLIILIATPFVYTFDVSPIFVYIAIIYGFVFNVFYYDDRNLLNRSIVSLPLNRNKIVLARYLFLLIVMVVYMSYIWLVDRFIHQPLGNTLLQTELKPLTGMSFLLVFSAVSLIIALIMPVFYYFQSFMKSFFLHGIFLLMIIVGFITLINYVDWIPKVIVIMTDFISRDPLFWLPFISLMVLALSYRISAFIYSRIDMI